MDTRTTGTDSERLTALFALGRLGGYVSTASAKLRVGSFRVLASSTDLDGLLYVDVYQPSDDDTHLVGREFLISPRMRILKSVKYRGGFRPSSKTSLSPREVFNEILKPCRSKYFSDGQSVQECEVRGYKCRYTYQVSQDDEHEVIALQTENGWETLHELRFSPADKADNEESP